MLGIIDLKIGNIGSVIKAIEYLGFDYKLVESISDFKHVDKIIFPGVGSFSAASCRLLESGFCSVIRDLVLEKKVPILGVCVGMQLLASTGDEGGLSEGLGFLDAHVRKLCSDGIERRVPHVGWNELLTMGCDIFEGLGREECFYFVHSYEMVINDLSGVTVMYTNYDTNIVAYINKGNIYGTQFHPEKSQKAGLILIRNFVEKC